MENLKKLICCDFNFTQDGIDCKCDKLQLIFADYMDLLKKIIIK